MNGQFAGVGPIEHLLVKVLVWMPNIHHKHDARKRVAIGKVLIY